MGMENIHKGHRQKLRNSFLETGLRGKAEHQMLELLLTYTLPRIDVNPIAHALIDRFGSIANVFDAPVEELCKVDYITENSAVLIKLIPELAKVYYVSKGGYKIFLRNLEELNEYMRPIFLTEKTECLYILCLDQHLMLKKEMRFEAGFDDKAPIDKRELFRRLVLAEPHQILIAHNHIGESSSPSAADISFTVEMAKGCEHFGINLMDHVVFSPKGYFSFKSNGLLPPQDSLSK